MNKKELIEILEKHKKWLNNEEGGKRADLRAAEIIEMLKQLPKEKQEFVNGYIQGVADTIAEQKESA